MPANVEADTVEEKQRSVELRVLGAIDRATGVRINTGASGERFEQWNDSGRFHIHPEELKMQQAIRNQVEEMFDEDDRD